MARGESHSSLRNQPAGSANEFQLRVIIDFLMRAGLIRVSFEVNQVRLVRVKTARSNTTCVLIWGRGGVQGKVRAGWGGVQDQGGPRSGGSLVKQ